MASLQLLTSNSHAKFGCFCSDFNSNVWANRRIRLQNSESMLDCRRFRVYCKVEESDRQSNGDEPPESMFMKELRRRGMTPTRLSEGKNRSINRDDEAEFMEEGGGRSYSRRKGVIIDAERDTSNQRQTSMDLNNEGLVGLVPRAKVLITLWRNILSAVLAIDPCNCCIFLCFISGNFLSVSAKNRRYISFWLI